MILLEKIIDKNVVRYHIDKGYIFREINGNTQELPGLYKLFVYTNFHNAYPLNSDYTVAVGMEKMGLGKIVKIDGELKKSDIKKKN